MTQFRYMDQQLPPETEASGHTTGWAVGLRQLYADVAREPVPADFHGLLTQLQKNLHRNGPA